MICPVPTSQISSFRGKLVSKKDEEKQSVAGKTAQTVKDVGKKISEQIPVTDNLLNRGSNSKKAKCSLITLASGGILSPLLGKVLDPLMGSEGKYVQWAEKIGNKTAGFDRLLAKIKLPQILPTKLKAKLQYYFKPRHVKMFKEGYYSVAGLEMPARIARNKAVQAGNKEQIIQAQRTLSTLFRTKKLGSLGKMFGKAGILIQKNLTGLTGVLNGLFATVTVVNVINAKPGEKVSTFMEDILGTWVGSIGGFKLFEGAINGLNAFIDPKTKNVIEKGLIPSIAKAVNKVPLKGLIIPMAGAAIMSITMKSISHNIFGKPEKAKPMTIDSLESLDAWIRQISG